MIKGLKIRRRYLNILAFINWIRFTIRKRLVSFELANLFLQRVDKCSLQLILRKNGAHIGMNCDIDTGLIFHNCKDYSNFIVGNNCHIGKACFFDLRDKIIIEDNVVISMQSTFITHIDLSKSPLSKKYKATQAPIVIKDNCYLGTGVKILKGVVIEQDTIIAAGAVVRKSVDSGIIVGGIPARMLKFIEWS